MTDEAEPIAPTEPLALDPEIVPSETINTKHVDQDACRVIHRLRRFGHDAYLVGGCVRDLLLDKPPKDFDVITSATPYEVQRVFSNSRVIGRRFRLVHVLFSNKTIEVSTFRSESTRGLIRETEEETLEETQPAEPREAADRFRGRRRKQQAKYEDDVADPNLYGTPYQDASRRDFTINALFYDPESGLIVDYVGGLKDIENRVIRSIRDPMQAIAEDPVRALRAVRFAAKLNFTIEPSLLAAMQKYSSDLARCASRRVHEEVLKILGGGSASSTIKLLSELGLLTHLLPEVASWVGDDIAEPEEPAFVEAVEAEESDEEQEPEDVPIIFFEDEDVEQAMLPAVARAWEPAEFMVDALVQTSWEAPPMEGSNEWNLDPETEVIEDIFEASSFQRDSSSLPALRHSAGLEAERARARGLLKVLKYNNQLERYIERFVIDNLEPGRTSALVELLVNSGEYVPIASRRDRLLRTLNGLDLLRQTFGEVSNALMLTALFAPQLWDQKPAEPLAAIDAMLQPAADRGALSKQDRELVRRLLASIWHGAGRKSMKTRHRPVRPTLSRRTIYAEALLLKWLDCRVNGRGWAELLQWEEHVFAPAVGARPSTHRVSLGLTESWNS